jgi:hypothetical protein
MYMQNHIRKKTKKRKQGIPGHTRKHIGGTIFDWISGSSSSSSEKKHDEFVQLSCSPTVDQVKRKQNIRYKSCLPKLVIYKLRDTWNAAHPQDAIPYTDEDDVSNIHHLLQKKLGKVCRSERCWLDKLNLTDVPQTKYFVPARPRTWEQNKTEWLSNLDLIKVLTQYEDAYPCFKFIPPAPIDFDKKSGNTCVTPVLCNFNLDVYISSGYTKIGIIFNTDSHTKSGSHWISLFINIPKQLIFFFDSAGDPCPPEIRNLVSRIIEQGKHSGILFEFDQNHPMIHQHSTTECGIYSLYFIIHMLNDDITTHHIKHTRITDKEMVRLRDVYFRPYYT